MPGRSRPGPDPLSLGRRTGWPGFSRLARVGVVAVLVLLLAGASELSLPRPNPRQPASASEYSNLDSDVVGGTWSWPLGQSTSTPLALREPDYSLLFDRETGMLTLRAQRGSFSFPATALIGQSAIPTGARFTAVSDRSQLTVYVFNRKRTLLEKARITAFPTFFTVGFSSRVGGQLQAPATFFSNGTSGLPATAYATAFSPDPVKSSLYNDPTTFLGVHAPLKSAPFAPPPFDLEFREGSGWAGVGLVQVPNATALSITPQGGITVNYDLHLLASIHDQGAGGRVKPPNGVPGAAGRGTWLSFPRFTFTMGKSTSTGLLSYHASLRSLHEAPMAFAPGKRPTWWSRPIVDTWGQQMVDRVSRRSPRYTASWVRTFVASWRRQFGLRHFTLVIDSDWQARLGHTTPSLRFGGVAGMRDLIKELHSQGVKVVLWWPLWVNQTESHQRLRVDPTAPHFKAKVAKQMTQLLGTGPGDLGADGLKLDWGELVPPPAAEMLARPQLGIGASLLLRYMTVLSKSAWKTDPTALIDASAVAPQFGGTESTLRLYDAHLASTWSYRAELVSAVDPTALIDGDGWRLDGAQATTHIVESTVFGIPALYYATRWSGGTRIRRSVARALGALVYAGEGRGQGRASQLRDGAWQYKVKGRTTAMTLADSHALVVYHYGDTGQCRSAVVVSAIRTRILVPECGRVEAASIGAGVSTTSFRVVGRDYSFSAAPGVTYRLAFFGTRHPH